MESDSAIWGRSEALLRLARRWRARACVDVTRQRHRGEILWTSASGPRAAGAGVRVCGKDLQCHLEMEINLCHVCINSINARLEPQAREVQSFNAR